MFLIWGNKITTKILSNISMEKLECCNIESGKRIIMAKKIYFFFHTHIYIF